MPTGKLSGRGKKLWEDVYQSELKGKCKGNKECAARKAWASVQSAGWKRDKEGAWNKKSDLVEFSMYFEKAPFDKVTKEMSFVASASDTEDDLYQDNMTQELFHDFLTRINEKAEVPEEFRSEFWAGGEPYISISHYPDLGGKAAAGIVDKSWVDGKCFKSKGHFFQTDLGKSAYKSIWEDLRSPLRSDANDKVRISIAFLDYKHMHKRSGYLFERKSIDDICPMCLMEIITGKREGKAYLSGHLIHEALTRVPVNQRTDIEPELVERSVMTTQKEDAKSIVGEELAEFLSEADKEKLKSLALVVHSDTDPGDDDEAEDTDELDELMAVTEPVEEKAKTKKPKADDETSADESDPEDEDESEDDPMMNGKKKKGCKKSEYEELRSAIVELSQRIAPTEHPLDPAFIALKSAYDSAQTMDASPDDRLRFVQDAYTAVGEQIVSLMKTVEPEPEVAAVPDVTRMITDALKPFEQKMEMLTAQLAAYKPQIQSPSAQPSVPVIPERRSINPALIAEKLNKAQPINGLSPRALARKSAGLPIE